MMFTIFSCVIIFQHILCNLVLGRRFLNIKTNIIISLVYFICLIGLLEFQASTPYFFGIMYISTLVMTFLRTRSYFIAIVFVIVHYALIQCSLSLVAVTIFTINMQTDILIGLVSINIGTFLCLLIGITYLARRFDIYLLLYKVSNRGQIAALSLSILLAITAYAQALGSDVASSAYWLYTFFLFFLLLVLFAGLYLLVKIKLYSEELFDLSLQYEKDKESIEEIRHFKHDYKNILLTLDALLEKGDAKGAREHLRSIKNYSSNMLNQDFYVMLKSIQILPLKSILFHKIYVAEEKGITVKLEINSNITAIAINILDFTRCLAILLDNAIEASEEAANPYLAIHLSQNDDALLEVIIQNTFLPSESAASLVKMQQKGFSTKAEHAGLGLYNYNKILNAYENITTSVNRTGDVYTTKIYISAI